MESINMFSQGIIAVISLVIGLMLGNYMPSYFGEKGKNLATKEDIDDITKIIESVKVRLKETDRVNEKKYTIKYDACITMLEIIDSHLSRSDGSYFDHTVQKQDSVAPSEIRQCHNKLLITIDNHEIIKLYVALTSDESDKEVLGILYQIRVLVREELGFGTLPDNDYSRSWLQNDGSETS